MLTSGSGLPVPGIGSAASFFNLRSSFTEYWSVLGCKARRPRSSISTFSSDPQYVQVRLHCCVSVRKKSMTAEARRTGSGTTTARCPRDKSNIFEYRWAVVKNCLYNTARLLCVYRVNPAPAKKSKENSQDEQLITWGSFDFYIRFRIAPISSMVFAKVT